MIRKLISFSLAAVMLSVTAFAADTATFSDVASDAVYVTEVEKIADSFLIQTKHEDVAELPFWDGTVAEGIIGGTGTAEDPYLISDGGELAYFANAVNGKLTDAEGNAIEANTTLCAKLDRDINLANEEGARNNWISYIINGYKGTFDGQGYNIHNLYISTSGNDYRGFFRSINAGANIKNFNMIDAKLTSNTSNINGMASASIVCGYASTDEANYLAGLQPVIENIYVSGTAALMGDKKGSIYGSVVGSLKYADIKNCFSDVAVNFAGNVATLKNYYAGQNANGSSIGVGGVIGVIVHDRNHVRVYNIGNAGKVYAPDNRRVGGVIGAIGGNGGYSNMYIDNIYNYGDVDGLGQVAGCVGWGFINKNGVDSTKNWYNTGDITAHTEEETWAAGIMNGTCSNTDKTFGGTLYSAGDVKIAVKDAETGEVSYKYNDKCALLTCGMATTSAKAIYRSDLDQVTALVTDDNGTPDDPSDDTQSEQIVNKWTTRSTEGVTGTYGTGKTLDEIKALTASEIKSFFSTKMVADFGINDGMPVLVTQKDFLAVYEIGATETANKSLAVKAGNTGHVLLEVTKFMEGTSATLEVYDAEGTEKLGEVTASALGNVSIPMYGESQIIIKAAEGTDVLVKEGASKPIDELISAPVGVSIESEEAATIFIALFNGRTLEKIKFCDNVAVSGGKVSGTIDLTGLDVAGRVLKAYLWTNTTLAPLGDVQDL